MRLPPRCRVAGARRPAAPEAASSTVSLVDWSPSTLTWSQVRATMGRSSPSRVSGSTLASVSRKQSMVAMLGWIMPTPLATPLMVTVTGVAIRCGERQRDGRSLGARVGRAQGFGDGREGGIVSGQPSGHAGLDGGPDALDRETRADEPGGHGQHVGWVAADGRGQASCQRALVGHAGDAGGRVGAAAGGQHGADPATPAAAGRVGRREVLTVELHRCRRQRFVVNVAATAAGAPARRRRCPGPGRRTS